MFTFMRYGRWLSCVAAVVMVASPLIAAEKSNKRRAEKVFDVTITKRGTIVGQVVTTAGQPNANAMVAAVSKMNVVANTKTDTQGVFQLPIENAGVYRIKLADRAFTVRAWQPELSPPAARDALLCVTQDATVRGQHWGHHEHLKSILTNPVVIGLGIATAIALPIALDDDDDDDDHRYVPDAS